MLEIVASFFRQAVIQGIPLLYGSTGEILTEKSGNLNLGIPGIMYIGGIMGVIGAYFYENAVEVINPFLAVLIPFACSFFGSMLMAADLQLPDGDAAREPERHGPCADDVRHGRGQLLRRLALKPVRRRAAPSRSTPRATSIKTTLPFADDLGLVRADVPVVTGSWPTWPSPSPSRRSTSSTTRGPASACAPWARARPRPTPRAST